MRRRAAHDSGCRGPRGHALTLIRLLKREGYDAAGAECGEAALSAIRAARPRLVILDCHMPGMDGLDVLRAMRADSRLSDIPVIMFSAAAGGEEREAVRLGAKQFIRKASLDWLQLRGAVEMHIAA